MKCCNNLEWNEIDALSIWELPPEDRPKNDSSEYNELWDRCAQLLMPNYTLDLTIEEQNRRKNQIWDNVAFAKAFCDAYRSYHRSSEKSSFKKYLKTAMDHKFKDNKRQNDEKDKYGFSLTRNTAANLRKINEEYKRINPKSDGLVDLLQDTEQLKVFAKAYGIRLSTLRCILESSLIMVRATEDDNENGPTAYDNYADPEGERFTETQPDCGEYWKLLHDFLLFSDLETREKWRKEYAIFTSAYILGDIRLKEKTLKDSIPERMNRCDEWRYFERDHCLWDDLLSEKYARFTIQEPFEPDMLARCAVNTLKRKDYQPHKEKTMADYRNVSIPAISQKRKKWEMKMQELLTVKESNDS